MDTPIIHRYFNFLFWIKPGAGSDVMLQQGSGNRVFTIDLEEIPVSKSRLN
jgi:hypothetical protein